jgi:S-adenosylmethionine hydrolase
MGGAGEIFSPRSRRRQAPDPGHGGGSDAAESHRLAAAVTPRPIVTLLTDFGAGSGYPAQMKGVLLSALPDAQLVDVSHEVPAFDVLAGALLLEACAPRFPAHAVHLAVVDPGVGTARRALCVVDGAGRRLVGPDNGLFTPFLEGGRAFLLSDPRLVPAPASATFHGRDLFAPVAAWLAAGGAPEALGPEVRDPVRLPWPGARRDGDRIVGTCLAADPFGNVLTSIRADDLAGAAPAAAEVASAAARWVRTFGEGAPGELVVLVGSGGRVEIAVREGSAAARGIARGAEVVLRLRRAPA